MTIATITRAPARANDFEWQCGIAAICARHGVTLEKLQTPVRFRALCRARLECYRYLQSRGWSTTRIGVLFNRDHSTIVQALATAERKAIKAVGAKRRTDLIKAVGT